MGNTIDVMNLYVNRASGTSKTSMKDSPSGSEDSPFRKLMDEASGQTDNRKPELDGSEDKSARPTQEPVGDEKPQRQETDEEETRTAQQAAVLLAAMSQNGVVIQPEIPETAEQPVSILKAQDELVGAFTDPVMPELVPMQSGEPGQGAEAAAQGQQQLTADTVFAHEGEAKQAAGDGGTLVKEQQPEQPIPQDQNGLMRSQGRETSLAEEEGGDGSQTVRAFSSETTSRPEDAEESAVNEKQPKAAREQQPEAPAVSMSQRMASQSTQDAAPVQATVRMEVQDAKDVAEQLMAQIERMAAGQQKKLEIVLEPEHLGRIVIQIASSREGTNVSMMCSEARTLNMLSARAADMGAILENRLGDHTVVYVDQQETNYLNQGRDESGSGGRRDREQQESSKKKQKDETVDFVSRLRLQMMQGLEQNYQIG